MFCGRREVKTGALFPGVTSILNACKSMPPLPSFTLTMISWVPTALSGGRQDIVPLGATAIPWGFNTNSKVKSSSFKSVADVL